MTVTTTPNLIPTETTKARVKRLAEQKIGSSEGTHPRVLAAQKARAKQKKQIDKRSKS